MEKPLLEQVDKKLSSLHYAVEIQRLAASVGFDWPDHNGVIEKIHEELNEVVAEIGVNNNQERLLDELGDLLFICASLARHLNIDPELALQAGNNKFYRRFSQVEQLAKADGHDFSDRTLNELDAMWAQVKLIEKATIKWRPQVQ